MAIMSSTPSRSRAGDLSNLSRATTVTCEFDRLRDEGAARAAALAAAGVQVQHTAARGHIHSSLAMVDMVMSGVPYREQMGQALSRFHQPERRRSL
jgi:acetyl esterase/lipase